MLATYLTGFGKTVPASIRIEIHFIAYYNSHTQALSRHSDTIARDNKKVCFHKQLFADPIKPCRTNTNPVGPLGCINRVACGPKLFHLTSALLVVWSGLWCLLCTQFGCLCLRALLTHPLPYLWHLWYFMLCSKHLSKSVSPSSSYVSIAISVFYFCSKSYVATIKHKEPMILYIFLEIQEYACKQERFSKIRSVSHMAIVWSFILNSQKSSLTSNKGELK